MNTVLAIDPGPSISAWVVFNGHQPSQFGICENEELMPMLRRRMIASALTIEGVASYGKPVGVEVFSTCIWIGRFIESWGGSWSLIYRPDIKVHLCHARNAKDPMVRQALLDRFGPGKDKAVGVKKSPGPLYGIKSHCWSALALAVTWWDTKRLTPDAVASTT